MAAKWEGKASAELQGPTEDQVWVFLEDFCGLNKWIPSIDICCQVDGAIGQPGLVRYCARTFRFWSDGREQTMTKWARERLVMMNPSERCLSYKIMENNLGFKSYVATAKVLPINGGCRIEWFFSSDPIDGWQPQDLFHFIDSRLQVMAKSMENEVRCMQLKG